MPLAEVLSLKIYTKKSASFVGTAANLRYITATDLWPIGDHYIEVSLYYIVRGRKLYVLHINMCRRRIILEYNSWLAA